MPQGPVSFAYGARSRRYGSSAPFCSSSSLSAPAPMSRTQKAAPVLPLRYDTLSKLYSLWKCAGPRLPPDLYVISVLMPCA